MERIRARPAWLIDALIAVALAALAVAIERVTQGRIATRDAALIVGGGAFVLLRGGAVLARAGRTLGCLYAFALTWLLPCAVLLFLAANRDMATVVRDSTPFFIYLGFVVIALMAITLERVRLADGQRRTAANGSERKKRQ